MEQICGLYFGIRGPKVAEYRAYILWPDGKIRKAIEMICDDDEAARASAKQLVDGHDIELWQLDRKVAILKHKPE
jgi:hypothetical protein